ncbi:hypothetical protein [Leptospira barantonii]|uniref:Lipoprotein n=1 Tax=Leptospira barantonii TaxID=2023184 RepID=A0ABX4NNE4_9LEPT|nr:hypothetical protein [Leptospira barantonii]PJZ58253.1 hypothetical protein CH367_07675 [Leptospira barantonii]
MKTKNILKTLLLLVCAFVLTAMVSFCAGIGGDQVAGDDDFKDRFETALRGKLLSCNILDPVASNAVILFWKDSTNPKGPLSFLEPSSYYTQRDIDFCVKSISATPCGANVQEFTSNQTLTILMYCRPKAACLLDKTHMGHGEWCVGK